MEGGGVDGWIVFGGPARAGPGGGGGGRHARGGGAAVRDRPLDRPPLGAGGPRRGASCRQAAGRRPEAADQRRGGGGAAGVVGGGEPPDSGRVPRPARRAHGGAGPPVDGGPGAAAVRLDVKEAQPARGRAGAGGRGRRARRVADGRGGGRGRARAGALGVPGRVRRAVVSVGLNGAQSDRNSDSPSLSMGGRYVAFGSEATNLVPGDTNGVPDIFVRDRQKGTTERVSVSSIGAQADLDSYNPSISANGRYIAFWSLATNLVQGVTGGTGHVYMRDRHAGTTELVS